MKNSIRVGITSVGSGVGQSVIDSCRLSKMSLYKIGLGANPMAFGAYDCDLQDTLPNIYAADYIEALLSQCKKHKIQVLIPGLDDELYNISLNINEFKKMGVIPIVASPEVIELCRDKEKMSNILNNIEKVFVNSYNKESLINQYNKDQVRFPLIAKPRSGFSSNGLVIIDSYEDFKLINDQQVIQEIAVPHVDDPNYESYVYNLQQGNVSQVAEISVQFVIGKKGNIIGKCATYNKLKGGVPIEIIPYSNDVIWQSLDKIITYLVKIGLKGPINIQGRITNEGPKFFEMNARFTGITGLRAMMGFNEVEALIKDFMNVDEPIEELKLNERRVGIRQVSNRTIQYGRNHELDKTVENVGYGNWRKTGKTVLLTGATGFLGTEIVRQLLQRRDIETIVCLVRDARKAKKFFSKSNGVKIFTVENIEQGLYSFGHVDVLIHAAFGRSHEGLQSISQGLQFTNWIMNTAYKHHVPAVINVSSQAVYGLSRPPLWKECLIPIPETPYGQAKWASELMVSNINENNTQICATSIRLSSILGPNLSNNELSYKFIKTVLKNEDIIIRGGTQNLDLLDVRDAAAGIISLLNLSPTKWKSVYNIGSGVPTNIKVVADTVNCAARALQKKTSNVVIRSEEISLDLGMDIKRISTDTGWRPKIGLVESFVDIIDWFVKNEEVERHLKI